VRSRLTAEEAGGPVSGLLPAVGRLPVTAALQIHFQHNRAVRIFGVETMRHLIDRQFAEGHADNVRSLFRWIGIERQPDVLGAQLGSQ